MYIVVSLRLVTKQYDWCWLRGLVAKWLGCWTCNQQVAHSNPGLPAVEYNPGQVVNTHVPLSPRCIIWYQPDLQTFPAARHQPHGWEVNRRSGVTWSHLCISAYWLLVAAFDKLLLCVSCLFFLSVLSAFISYYSVCVIVLCLYVSYSPCLNGFS